MGVDDGAFPPGQRAGQKAILVAVLFEGIRILTVRAARIQVDGRDANGVLASMLKGMHFDGVILSGISFGGFNVIDIKKLSKATGKPVIAVTGEKPDNAAVKRALQAHFPDWRDRWHMVRAAGKLYSASPLKEEPMLYFEVAGASPRFARTVIAATSKISRLPEPIRVAGILARGLSGLRKA